MLVNIQLILFGMAAFVQSLCSSGWFICVRLELALSLRSDGDTMLTGAPYIFSPLFGFLVLAVTQALISLLITSSWWTDSYRLLLTYCVQTVCNRKRRTAPDTQNCWLFAVTAKVRLDCALGVLAVVIPSRPQLGWFPREPCTTRGLKPFGGRSLNPDEDGR